MQSSDFDDLLARWRQFSGILATVYRDVTGEELNLESAVRHYPLVALGVAAGVGFVAGQTLARRSEHQLPPPPPTRGSSSFEQFLPAPFERVRELLPEWSAEEAEAQARVWIDTVIEPRIRETLESTRFGSFLRRTREGRDEDDTAEQDPEI